MRGNTKGWLVLMILLGFGLQGCSWLLVWVIPAKECHLLRAAQTEKAWPGWVVGICHRCPLGYLLTGGASSPQPGGF